MREPRALQGPTFQKQLSDRRTTRLDQEGGPSLKDGELSNWIYSFPSVTPYEKKTNNVQKITRSVRIQRY